MKSLLAALLVGGLTLSFVPGHSGRGDKITEFHNMITEMERLILFDQNRQIQNRKILEIVNRFNPETGETAAAMADVIYEMSVRYPNLDIDLICATITHESARTWDPRIVSDAGAMGLMQIMPRTGKWLARFEDIEWTTAEDVLFDPILNIRLGCRYLSALIETYDLEGGLAAYNGGGTRVQMWLRSGKDDKVLWEETRNYIPLVLKLYDEFKNSTIL